MGQIKLKKFTSLAAADIQKIIARSNDDLVKLSGKIAATLAKEEFADLVTKYQAALDKRSFFEDNFLAVTHFLNECGLIGWDGENRSAKAENITSYTVGSEAVSLVTNFLIEKDQVRHPIQIVKNKSLKTADGASLKHADIALETSHIHQDLKRQLTEDLQENQAQDFNRTYLVEMFGTTGGSHFTCLTLRSKKGEIEPMVDLFDPSPGLTRNGLQAGQNSVANGWSANIAVNATLKETFEELGLKFSGEKFYSNSEPVQIQGSSYCASFAYEVARIHAKMTRNQHEKVMDEMDRDLEIGKHSNGKSGR